MTRALPLLLVLLAASASAQPEPVRVPGSRVSLAPPPGFRPADGFAGFQNDSLSASILVTEIPGAPLDEAIAGLTPEALAQQQRFIVSKETDVVVGGVPSRLIRGTQSQAGVRFDRWVLVTGDSVGVVLATAAAPVEAADGVGAALERALLTLSLADEGPADPFEGLPFSFAPPDGLPEPQRVGANVSFSEGPGIAGPGDPLYIAGTGWAPVEGDLGDAVRRRLAQTATVVDLGAPEGRPVVVGGRPGYEAVAEGADEDDGTPVTVYLVLVPTDGGYALFQGLVGSDRVEVWLPRFRAATASVRWR